MDQEILIDAIGNHLGAIESYVDSVMILALATVWAGVRWSREIEAFGVKFDRRHAFWALATMYFVANAAVLVLLLRIGDLLSTVDKDHAVEAITTVVVHSWLLNPFGSFGTSNVAKLHSAVGSGLLVAVWWLCNTSLSTLMEDKRNRAAQTLFALFFAIGLVAMLAIYRVQELLLERLPELPESATLYTSLSAGLLHKMVANGFGAVIGGLFFIAANKLQARVWSERIGGKAARIAE